MKEIVLASGNAGKLAEFRAILNDFKVLSPKDLNIEFDVDETGKTFYDNAFIKARALYEICKLPTIADDSGLCVNALNGAPGVFSARYSGGTDKDNNKKLLREMDGAADRKAYFESCIVYYDGMQTIAATGRTYGVIAQAESGEGGFGYDPLFVSDDLGKTFGEASEAEKNGVSHRARALAGLAEKLRAAIIK
ncbi:MAG: RdgB/HAM1 family non-canonical purine NTP pyrophosphatase [Clostridiales bacterium]|nr:RdgB/HAM1 family non-canonical purine NTP pyrophosphatase [Clostridiales bacterium]